ncbi:hydrolase [Rhodobacter phage RcCronus]|uniref:Hydrolase n=1 Tax=Rhodobacter phage RcCronus TaxID=1662333 RepID=A0A0K1LLC1_9CAUD|nr:tail protein [Rhodobacter phage RcCronus]AKU43307.1 hydrolase [Rhodobacter phage RcCronus]
MATLVFAAIGAQIGAGIGGAVLGMSAAAIGQAVGGMIGRAVDQALLAPTQKVTGPRLDSVEVQKSQEGTGLPVVEGVGRVAGSIIWATRLEEVKKTSKKGGKGGGGKVESTEYSYFANFAVALTDCTTGPVRHFGRIWADGKPLDTSELNIRFYHGTETQVPDRLMVEKDGFAPAYRGISYVVFERMPVADFGRRIPSLMFEVWGPSGHVEDMVQGVDLIPASTEFGYSTEIITSTAGSPPTTIDGSPMDAAFLAAWRDAQKSGTSRRENAVRDAKTTDWKASLDFMQDTLPACNTVALVVSWFGSDLRAGHCQIAPRVEIKEKDTSRPWTAGGLTRDTAGLVSHVDGKPAFGSSPDDQSVMEAIADLKARGLRVVLYPFIMMDIPGGNTLPRREGGTGQPVFPWRGRIGPATGGGSVASQISALVGTASPGHFTAGSGVPTYSGPAEWSYRRFILHLAALARNAGGVDAFLIGSELVDLTTATDTAGVYPFVNSLVTLAADVKGMLPGAAVSYAADWSEYHSHRDGGQVYFHLDSLWASPSVDFVGIDNYLPLSDWRPGADHADYDPETGVTSPYCLDYLKGQIEGGEYWDYYYASQADRDRQIRTPISDLGYGEHWVFRQKAIRDWWSSNHHNRPGGIRAGAKTSWTPGSKPVWFTEYGCPAVHLGPNQPNVFFDALSSEAALPHYSNGARDDFVQRQYLRAMLEWWAENGGAMLDPANMLVWTWDARPWPEFPRHASAWSDGPNWDRGHWLNGRLGSIPAAEAVERRLKRFYGMTDADMDLTRCFGQADGAILPGPLPFRDMLATWETALRLDASEYGGIFKVASRAAAIPVAAYVPDDLVESGDAALYTITRTALEETPRSAVVRYSDWGKDYERAAARATIRERPGEAETEADLALVSDLPRMTAVAEMILRAAADEREMVEFALPPSSPLEPGQVFTLTPRNGGPVRFIALDVTRGADRKVRASLYSGAAFGAVGGPARPSPGIIAPPSEVVLAHLLDLPLLPGLDMEDHQGLVAFQSDPWPGGADLFRSQDQATGYAINLRSGLPGTVGLTTAPLPPGVTDIWSGEVLGVALFSGTDLIPRDPVDVLAGQNALAIEHAPGQWEVVQFRDAVLVGPQSWRLTGLLRGQAGTEWVRAETPLPAGARVVLLDAGVLPVAMQAGDVGRPFWFRSVPAGRDPAGVAGLSHTFAGIGQRPYAPAHLRASLSGSDLSLSWVRRTRVDGDAWRDSGDVPLAEASERYRVEIGPEGAPVMSADVTTRTASLDVSGLSGTLPVRVAQVSETYGPGSWATVAVAF